MPLIPPRLMSMRMTSGFSRGRCARASSALLCMLTQRKPSDAATFSRRRAIGLGRGNHGFGIKPAAVVFNPDFKSLRLDAHRHADLGSAAVFERVVQRFLEREKKIVAGFGGQRVMRQAFRDVQ